MSKMKTKTGELNPIEIQQPLARLLKAAVGKKKPGSICPYDLVFLKDKELVATNGCALVAVQFPSDDKYDKCFFRLGGRWLVPVPKNQTVHFPDYYLLLHRDGQKIKPASNSPISPELFLFWACQKAGICVDFYTFEHIIKAARALDPSEMYLDYTDKYHNIRWRLECCQKLMPYLNIDICLMPYSVGD
jgi:hypothetical protein